jgi:hypothetical protein
MKINKHPKHTHSSKNKKGAVNMAESIIAKTFMILARNGEMEIEIDYESTIYTKHSVKLKYKNWTVDIHTQKTKDENCNFIKVLTIRIMKDGWILFSNEQDDYPIKDTKEVKGDCYHIYFKKTEEIE